MKNQKCFFDFHIGHKKKEKSHNLLVLGLIYGRVIGPQIGLNVHYSLLVKAHLSYFKEDM